MTDPVAAQRARFRKMRLAPAVRAQSRRRKNAGLVNNPARRYALAVRAMGRLR